jgi:hypothetical protein
MVLIRSNMLASLQYTHSVNRKPYNRTGWTSLELTILLSQPANCWNYRHAPPCLSNELDSYFTDKVEKNMHNFIAPLVPTCLGLCAPTFLPSLPYSYSYLRAIPLYNKSYPFLPIQWHWSSNFPFLSCIFNFPFLLDGSHQHKNVLLFLQILI